MPKDPATDAIAIGEKIVGGCIPREGLSNLPGRPFRGGMGGDVGKNYSAPMMGRDHKEDSKVYRRHHRELRRELLLHMTVEERTLRLGG
jgi:hypothetical protein